MMSIVIIMCSLLHVGGGGVIHLQFTAIGEVRPYKEGGWGNICQRRRVCYCDESAFTELKILHENDLYSLLGTNIIAIHFT